MTNTTTRSKPKPAEVYYLHAELDVPRDNVDDFKAKMREIVGMIHDLYHWELVYAAYPITGKLNRFTQIWRIPDPKSVLEVMLEGSPTAGTFGVDNPHLPAVDTVQAKKRKQFQAAYQEVQNLIENTSQFVTTSLPHDPGHAGFQSQTLLYGANEQVFLVDHDQMREAWKDKDIDIDLEGMRFANIKDWEIRARYEAEPKPEKPPSNEQREKRLRELAKVLWKERGDYRKQVASRYGEAEDGTATTKELQNLQALLNVGVTSAEVKLGQKVTQLFNLSALKARSVLQEVKTPEFAPGHSQAGAPLKAGDMQLPAGIEELLIATPWGSVYRVNEADLTKIARPVAGFGQEVLADTKKRLAPLIAAKTQLASIPEERDETVGDGCMCYVINLHSFVRK